MSIVNRQLRVSEPESFREVEFRAQDACLNVRIRTAKVFSPRTPGEDFAKRKADEPRE
jgi:hypothetical protein